MENQMSNQLSRKPTTNWIVLVFELWINGNCGVNKIINDDNLLKINGLK